MKLNFDFPIKGLDGKDIVENNIKVMMKNIFSDHILHPEVKIGDVVKKYSLAQKIYAGGDIELDEADFNLLKEISKLNNIFTPLVQAQLINYFNSVN